VKKELLLSLEESVHPDPVANAQGFYSDPVAYAQGFYSDPVADAQGFYWLPLPRHRPPEELFLGMDLATRQRQQAIFGHIQLPRVAEHILKEFP
jgi:hypothetical protein